MEAPPAYPGSPKKSKTGLILGLLALSVVLCCCVCGGLVTYFGPKAAKGAFGFMGCGLSMGENRDALLDYAKDHGDKLPDAKSWQDAIKPYLAKRSIPASPNQPFQIPGPDDDFCDAQSVTGLSMNAALSGKRLSTLDDKMGTILLFETPGRGRNKSAAWKESAYETSPEMFMGVKRGWFRQPVEGEAAFKDEKGELVPFSRVNRNNIQFDVKP